MPTRDDRKTMVSEGRITSGEAWKNEDSANEWTAEENYSDEESREDWESMDNDAEDGVAPVFGGLIDDLDPEAGEDALDLFEEADDDGLVESDEWDDFSEDAGLDDFEDLDEI